MTGCARLATEVHARRAALDDRMAADCLLAVCRVADELELPILADLITLRERMWGRLLDHGRAERLHVSESAYPSYMAAPVSPEEVGALMAERDWQWTLPVDRLSGRGGLDAADAACDNLITFRAHMLVRHQFGSEIDWHLRLFDDKESTVSLGAQPFHPQPGAGLCGNRRREYAAARRAAALVVLPHRRRCPTTGSSSGPWRTLEVGNRQAICGRRGRTSPGRRTPLTRRRTRCWPARGWSTSATRWPSAAGPTTGTRSSPPGWPSPRSISPELRHADAYLRVALRRLQVDQQLCLL